MHWATSKGIQQIRAKWKVGDRRIRKSWLKQALKKKVGACVIHRFRESWQGILFYIFRPKMKWSQKKKDKKNRRAVSENSGLWREESRVGRGGGAGLVVEVVSSMTTTSMITHPCFPLILSFLSHSRNKKCLILLESLTPPLSLSLIPFIDLPHPLYIPSLLPHTKILLSGISNGVLFDLLLHVQAPLPPALRERVFYLYLSLGWCLSPW